MDFDKDANVHVGIASAIRQEIYDSSVTIDELNREHLISGITMIYFGRMSYMDFDQHPLKVLSLHARLSFHTYSIPYLQNT